MTDIAIEPFVTHAHTELIRIFARRLRQDRRRKRVSLSSLANRTGVPSQLIRTYERGHIPIPIATLWLLYEGFGEYPSRAFHPRISVTTLQTRRPGS